MTKRRGNFDIIVTKKKNKMVPIPSERLILLLPRFVMTLEKIQRENLLFGE